MFAGIFLLMFATIGAVFWMTTVPAVDRLLRKGSAGFLLALWSAAVLIMIGATSVGSYEPGSFAAALRAGAFCVTPLAAAILTFYWRDLYPPDGGEPAPPPEGSGRALVFILMPAASALLAGAGYLLGLGTWEELVIPAFLVSVSIASRIEKRIASSRSGDAAAT